MLSRFIYRGVLTVFLVSLSLLCLTVPRAEGHQEIHDDLFSVTFPSEKEGWASGRWGCILHTADGGKTWTRQKTGTDLTLSSVFFIDNNRGWAVGEEGVIIHTEDGGKNWQKQKSPFPFFHMKVFFVSPMVGYIVSEWTHIFYTADGGRNWQVKFKDQDYILKSVSFSDSNNGWAVGEYGFIYHTRNGGTTWEQQAGGFGISEKTGDVESGNYLFDVKAIDPQTAWAVGIDGYVTKTGDGGKTWQDIPVKIPKTQLFAVAVDSTRTILIAGNGVFVISPDGGKTWKTPVFAPPIIYSWIYGVGLRGNAGYVAVGGNGVIYLSEGKNPLSWKQVEY
jgi:photosystem II stability/assembly factor-like uncharacterized protein